jgi:hypothetical protein
VVVTSKAPTIILIDEPNSFLHPGALRTLLEILAAHPQHQYVLTTHSPVALMAAPDATLHLFKKRGPASEIVPIDPGDTDGLRNVLSSLGARLSDVFGYDQLLWVEGATGENCFQLILNTNEAPGGQVTGTKIIGVLETGDFEGRDRDRVIRIYNRLSHAHALLPPSVGFLFDRELRTPDQRKEIEKLSGGKVKFLPRRMFENYLLVPSAIAMAANAIEGFRSPPVEGTEVETWLNVHGREQKYLHDKVPTGPLDEETWLREVHGRLLLEDLFKNLSEYRVQYDKKRDGPKLTSSILESRPQHLAGLAAVIREAMGPLPASG